MIKIYVENIHLNDSPSLIENFNTISKSYKSYIKYDIYSKTGIYIINNNSICKIVRKDVVPEKKLLNNKHIIIDKSTDTILKNIYQIPIEHKIHKKIINQYKLNDKSKLTFIIERIADDTNYNKLKIVNYYFTLQNTENINNIEDEIDTFLSVFN
jgi:hypothetical protein